MERQIKGIFIPIEIWENKELSWNEKILLMEIDSFTSKDLPCYFSNEYIAELLGVKENTASIILSKLIKKGYVRKVGFNGRERFVESLLRYSCGDLFAGFDGNQSLPLNPVKHNNTSIIDTSIIDNNNTRSDKKKEKENTIKEKKENLSLEEKRAKFRSMCDPYIEKYGKKMVDEFYLYWSEANGNKMKCEIAKQRCGAFEVGRRLATWASKTYNQTGYQSQPQPTPQPQRPKKTPWEEMGLSKEDYVLLMNGQLIK